MTAVCPGALASPATSMTTSAFAGAAAPVPAAPPGQLGNWIGDQINDTMATWFDSAMKSIWAGCLDLLGFAMNTVDQFSTFTVSTTSGPIGAVWPTLIGLSVVIALALFFWQLTLAAVRGGAGMIHAATGPAAYGIALGMSVAAVTAMLTFTDGATTVIFNVGLKVASFGAAWQRVSLGTLALDGIKPVVLGLVGAVGFFPAAFGIVLETIWRQATILVLVATIPITAAGLLAQSTASWFWRGMRWTLAAIIVKPALALIIVIGVLVIGGSTGPVELLAGAGVLWVSLVAPPALFKLLAFVDPNNDKGADFRSWLRSATDNVSDRLRGIGGGADDSDGSPAGGGGSGGGSGGGGGGGRRGGGVDQYEDATDSRFGGSGDAGSTSGSSGSGGSPAWPGDDDQPAPAPAAGGHPGGGAPGGTGPGAGAESGGSSPAPGNSTGSPGSGDGSHGGGAQPPPADPDPGPPDGGTRPPSGPSGGPSTGGGAGSAGADAAQVAAEGAVLL